MIPIKNEREIAVMRRACKITAAARALAGEMVRPGVTTKAIDKAVHDFIVSQGATPSFLHYSGYPASVCISVNNTVIHGIPDGRVLQEGDIVSVDVGAKWQGFHGDCAATYACGKISPEAQRLIDVTKQSFFEGVKFARQGCRISDIGHAVQTYAESFGCGVVRDFVGHGVGEHLHEEPEVPNYGKPGRGPRLIRGMVIAIEPMINAGPGLDGLIARPLEIDDDEAADADLVLQNQYLFHASLLFLPSAERRRLQRGSVRTL